jgi:hypothetical protein
MSRNSKKSNDLEAAGNWPFDFSPADFTGVGWILFVTAMGTQVSTSYRQWITTQEQKSDGKGGRFRVVKSMTDKKVILYHDINWGEWCRVQELRRQLQPELQGLRSQAKMFRQLIDHDPNPDPTNEMAGQLKAIEAKLLPLETEFANTPEIELLSEKWEATFDQIKTWFGVE